MSEEIKEENKITKTQAAIEVLRREKTIKTVTIFNIIAVFICTAVWGTSQYLGGLFILASVGYNAWLMYKAEIAIKGLTAKYGL